VVVVGWAGLCDKAGIDQISPSMQLLFIEASRCLDARSWSELELSPSVVLVNDDPPAFPVVQFEVEHVEAQSLAAPILAAPSAEARKGSKADKGWKRRRKHKAKAAAAVVSGM
jgi:hypothetical protein